MNDASVKGSYVASYTIFPSMLMFWGKGESFSTNKGESLVTDEYFKEKALKIYKSTFLSYE